MALSNKVPTWLAVAGIVIAGLPAALLIQNNCLALNQLKGDSAVRPAFIEYAVRDVLVDLLVAEDAAEQIGKELIRWSSKQYEAEGQAEGKIPNTDSFVEYTVIRVGDHVAPKKHASKQGDGILFMYIDMTDGAVAQNGEAYLITMCEWYVASKKVHKGAFVLKRAADGKFEVSSIDAVEQINGVGTR